MLTGERLKYRPDALAVAEKVLSRRGLVPPPEPFAPAPLPARTGPRRAKSPYGMVDLIVDALLVGFVCWAAGKLDGWTTSAGPVWGAVIYYLTFFALLSSVLSLRRRWRAIEWN